MNMTTVTAVSLILLFVSHVRGDLIVNGDFESGNTGFDSDFTFSPGDITAPATYDIVTDPRNSHGSATSYGDHTTGAGLMLAANGSTDTDSIVWSQQVSVALGTDYQFDVWTSTWFSNARLQLQINSVDIGTSFTTPTSNGVWELTSRSWNSGAASVALLELVNTTSGYTGNDFALDDISFALVPEPSIFSLFGVIGTMIFLRRRHHGK